jgi:hypothetical protein
MTFLIPSQLGHRPKTMLEIRLPEMDRFNEYSSSLMQFLFEIGLYHFYKLFLLGMVMYKVTIISGLCPLLQSPFRFFIILLMGW